MQAPEKEATKEKVAQDVTIHEATSKEGKVQIEGSITMMGKNC